MNSAYSIIYLSQFNSCRYRNTQQQFLILHVLKISHSHSGHYFLYLYIFNNLLNIIFSAHLMFFVGDDPSQRLQRLKSKPSLLCTSPVPGWSAVAAVLLRVRRPQEWWEKFFQKSWNAAQWLHHWCSASGLLLVRALGSCTTQRPTTYVFLFFPRRCCRRHTLRERSQNASPQGLGAGGASLALIVFEGSLLCALPP